MDRIVSKLLNIHMFVFPAHAGMDRHKSVGRGSGTVCSPHTRGWTGSVAGVSMGGARVPRTRGDGPQIQDAEIASRRVFPAHAGMDRDPGLGSISDRGCSPHTRGWTAPTADRKALACWCSPHTRGWTVQRKVHGEAHSCVPRTRGDGPYFPPPGLDWAKCSPHTRGWTAVDVAGPAVAVRVPRTRGDGPHGQHHWPTIAPCSPHTRGWTAVVFKWPTPSNRVPRTRGDGPKAGYDVTISPAVFPAHAGMDR